MAEHYTQVKDEGRFVVDNGMVDPVEEARKLHHLASADPEPNRDGMMTGPAHEARYGLEREAFSVAAWRSAGVHPTEGRALVKGEDGAENLRGATGEEGGGPAIQTTAAPRASAK
ncbi:MAG: hypothetical protein NVS3B26_16490 [Mycobacteriales bacterium]